MFDYKSNRVRCDTCGRFMIGREPGSSWVFVPGSDVSYEEDKEQCKKCTLKFGALCPSQSVRLDICCGIYKRR